MQEIVAVNICKLARLNITTCTEILLSWNPREISTGVADQILVDIIARQPHKWWLRKKGGLKYISKKYNNNKP